jgi:hypothetical protein
MSTLLREWLPIVERENDEQAQGREEARVIFALKPAQPRSKSSSTSGLKELPDLCKTFHHPGSLLALSVLF